jgi:OOP family OmpA-OmpF porin
VRNIMAVAAISASLVIGVAYPGSAWPASDTSVQDVIDALKPHPGKSRGSKPVIAPPGETTAPVATAPSTAMHAPTAHITTAPADFNITFASGSAELTPQAVKVLDTLGKALASNELSNSKFRIEGHTDTVGAPDANKDLSARRATAVVSYLSQHYSIASSRLEAVGMGEEALLVPTGPGVSEQRNRRVHVVNVSG